MSTTPQPITRQKSLEEDLAEVTGSGSTAPAGKRMSIPRSLTTLTEDVGYPSLGAFVGGAIGAPLGPLGMAGGAAIGGMAGEAGKDVVRSLTGRVSEVPESGQQAINIATAGIAGPLQETGTMLRGGQRALQMTPQTAGAIEFGVDITKGQAQGGIRKAFENFLSKTIGGSRSFKALGQKQAAQLEAGIDDFVSRISKTDLAPDEAGNLLSDLIGATRKRLGSAVEGAEKAITQTLPDLKVRNEGAIATRAKELLTELRGPTKDFEALRSFGDFNKAIKLLEQFARTEKAGAPIQKSISDALELKRLLQDAANFGEVGTKGEAALKRMAGTLRSEIESVVRQANPQLADNLAQADEAFSSAIKRIDSRAIKQLLREDKPEVVLDIMLRKGAKTRISRIEELVGPQEIKPIARAAVQKIFDDATNEGVLISQSFASLQKKIGKDTINKLLGSPENVASFERLSKLIDQLGLTSELTKPSSAVGGMGLLQGGLASAAGGIMAIQPERALEGSLFVAGVVGLPAALAKMATRKGALVNLERILSESVAREGRQVAAQRLMGIVLAEKTRSEGRGLARQDERSFSPK